MIYSYPAVFYKEDKGYSVIFPDFNNATCGNSFDEAMYMAMELLAINIQSCKEDNIPLPKPTDIANVNNHDEYFDSVGISLMVSCDAEEYIQSCNDKGVHCIVTIPHNLFDKAFDKEINLSDTLKFSLEHL